MRGKYLEEILLLFDIFVWRVVCHVRYDIDIRTGNMHEAKLLEVELDEFSDYDVKRHY